MTHEEEMLEGLRNTAKSRSTMRLKHMEQLELTKSKLSKLKSRQVLNEDDLEFPPSDYINDRSTTAEKFKHAEAVLNRIASAKIKDAT